MASEKEVLDSLVRDRHEAARLVQTKGVAATRKLLARAQRDLEARLERAGDGTFTQAQLQATLARVKAITVQLTKGMEATILDQGDEAARAGATSTARHLVEADKAFRGLGTQPLALDEARMLDVASQGVRSSLLRRIALSGTKKAKGIVESEVEHRGKPGVLERYGVATINRFEQTLRAGLVAKKSWREVREDLVEDSDFLKGAPAHWAERIVRTEMMGAYNKGAWESSKEANEQLGDVVKILSATFDDRTGADSYAVHGQIRRVDEPFDWWDGAYMHPPNRPNDREVVITHRLAWPIPDELQPVSDGEVTAAWRRDGRKGGPPGRPNMSTVPRSEFAKKPEKEKPEEKPKAPEKRLPPRERRKEFGAELRDALGEAYDPKKGAYPRARVRNLVREHLTSMGLRSHDVEMSRSGRDELDVVPDRALLGAAAVHEWDGGVVINETTHENAMKALQKLKDGEVIMPYQQRGISTLMHEEIHGASPIRRSGYRGLGQAFEEAGTEILARKATSDLVGTEPTESWQPGALPETSDREAMTVEWTDNNGPYNYYIQGVLHAYSTLPSTSKVEMKEIHSRVTEAFREIRSATKRDPDTEQQVGVEYTEPHHQMVAFCKAKALKLSPEEQAQLMNRYENHGYIERYVPNKP